MGRLAAFRPTQRQLHRITSLLFSGWMGRTLIKDHHHITAQIPLHLHRLLRINKYRTAINRRLELHALFSDLAHIAETKHLKTTGISKDRTLPLSKIMQIAMGFNHFSTGSQHQVESIAENNFSTDLNNIFRQHTLNRAIGSHRHKRRCLHRATGKAQLTTTSFAVSRGNRKFHKAFASFFFLGQIAH